MADVLSHVLLAFVIFTVIGWHVDWIDRRWVAVAMVGAIFPDLNRVRLLVDNHVMVDLLGLPFNWGAIHTLGGVLVLSLMGAILFATWENRFRGFILLLGGALTHLFVDVFKVWADGYASPYLYPITWYRLPTPGLYVSADRWVVVVAILMAALVFLVDYVRTVKQSSTMPVSKS